MTLEELQEHFNSDEDEYLKFERIEHPTHPRPDICAFLLLAQLDPRKGDMVAAAEHDEIFLDVDVNRLAEVATKEDLLILSRCGVRYSDRHDCLAMFV